MNGQNARFTLTAPQYDAASKPQATSANKMTLTKTHLMENAPCFDPGPLFDVVKWHGSGHSYVRSSNARDNRGVRQPTCEQ